jgi:hypothetical protein
LTGEQHTDQIATEQRVSRHSLPTLLYFLFFPTTLFFNSNKRSDSRAPLKNKLNKRVTLAPRIGTFAFACLRTSHPKAKSKEPTAHALFSALVQLNFSGENELSIIKQYYL